jgi:hypothetical protein
MNVDGTAADPRVAVMFPAPPPQRRERSEA